MPKIARILDIQRVSEPPRVGTVLRGGAGFSIQESWPSPPKGTAYRLNLLWHSGAGGGWSKGSRTVFADPARITPSREKASIPAAWSGMLLPNGASVSGTGTVSIEALHEKYETFRKQLDGQDLKDSERDAKQRAFWEKYRFHRTSDQASPVKTIKAVDQVTAGTIYEFSGIKGLSRKSSSASVRPRRLSAVDSLQQNFAKMTTAGPSK